MRLVCIYGVDEENRKDRENGTDGPNGIDGEDKADRADRTIKTIKTIKKKNKFVVRRVADATLGKNPDDGLYFSVLLIVGTLFASGGRCALITRNKFVVRVV